MLKLYHLDWEKSVRRDPEAHLVMSIDGDGADALYLDAFLSAGLYVHVADVDTADFGYLYAATNNVEGPAWNMAPAEGVFPERSGKGRRSTSTGDIVVQDGRILVIGSFRDIGPAPSGSAPGR